MSSPKWRDSQRLQLVSTTSGETQDDHGYCLVHVPRLVTATTTTASLSSSTSRAAG